MTAAVGEPSGPSDPSGSGVTPETPFGEIDDYPTGSKVVAAVLTLFVPFISLVVALVLRSAEHNPTRRDSLRGWAVFSGVWLAAGIVIGLIAVASVGSAAAHHQPSTSGPCDGGPQMGANGVSVGHGNYRFPCEFGGSTIVHFGG